MDFNLVTSVETCYRFVQGNTGLVVYSHVPTALVALIFGFYVYLSGKRTRSSANGMFFLIAIFFSLWSALDLAIWFSYDSRKTMFVWSLVNMVEMLVSMGTLYFAYLFLEKKDVSFRTKMLYGSALLPLAILTPTAFNISGFDVAVCEAKQGPLIDYYYALDAFLFLSLLIFVLSRIVRSRKGQRKQIAVFGIGAVLFLTSFSGANIVGSLAAILYPDNPDNWKILQYGLFGMPIFMGFLAYLIVRYEAFNIKLMGAQALVLALVALIGSQFFFIQNETNKVLTAITLVISVAFGWILIRSVRKEVERKEELQRISDSLAAANQRLKELDNTKTEFISIASHQLRTPLTAIKGYLSLLLEGSYGAISTDVRDVLEKVNLVNRNLIGLVEDLLNVSRIDAGRIRYSFVPTSVETLVSDRVGMFMPLAREKGIDLSVRLPESPLPKLSLDAGKIGESISNLIDNALKYTDRGSVTVSVEPIRSESSVRIVVADTGIGFSPEDGAKLFEKFVRTEATTKKFVSGTGLGLYVGKSFVAAHGGRMWAESDGIGRGARFFIDLPIRNPHDVEGTGR